MFGAFGSFYVWLRCQYVRCRCTEFTENKLNCDLNKIYSWLMENKLAGSVSKTEYMITGSRKQLTIRVEDPNSNIRGQIIKRVYSSKSLGVIIDEEIEMRRQIDRVCKNFTKVYVI